MKSFLALSCLLTGLGQWAAFARRVHADAEGQQCFICGDDKVYAPDDLPAPVFQCECHKANILCHDCAGEAAAQEIKEKHPAVPRNIGRNWGNWINRYNFQNELEIKRGHHFNCPYCAGALKGRQLTNVGATIFANKFKKSSFICMKILF